MAKLVIFDIDGTLTDSNTVDATCYVRSLKEEFGIEDIDESWETYKNVTDSGVLDEIFEQVFSRKPTESEIRRHIQRFIALLEESCTKDSALCAEIPGARDMLSVLRASSDWKIGIATGAWRESALFKLITAGIDIKGLPLVTGSDSKSREDMIQKCIAVSQSAYGVNAFQRIVSVGDGIWDLRTAANLKIPFIGINTPEKFRHLAECLVLRDYRAPEKFMQFLEEARAPVLKD